MTLLVLVFAALAFTLSACVGLGGSLILVPAVSLLLGPKAGVALAGLLLAGNNVAKVIAYRRTLPFGAIAAVLLPTALGAYVGATLLVAAPASWVSSAVIVVIASCFVAENREAKRTARLSAPLLALLAGLTSGFAGTSGPLKGLALRGLTGDRLHLAGAASVVSLVADVTKAAVYVSASLVDRTTWTLAVWAWLLAPFAVALGYRLNQRIGEPAYRVVFWSVMFGYSVRLAFF